MLAQRHVVGFGKSFLKAFCRSGKPGGARVRCDLDEVKSLLLRSILLATVVGERRQRSAAALRCRNNAAGLLDAHVAG